ncbi:MAG: MoxR family ATPase [Acidimicrobiaceae bacterium]|nr:MoxR family ATPase [Acidimicrobiaceae bacterium]
MPDAADGGRAEWFAARFEALADQVARVIRGKRDVIELSLVCLFAEGHLLIEDVPGVGKTSLARAIATSIDASFHRIQFTPDLLPTDVTGVTVYRQDSGQFVFHKGPVFANVVVADEINRASPKTQSALLEVMEERQVTVDSISYPVGAPFLVIATQNPIELDGTYRLPEAQIDRFLMRVTVGYPDLAAEQDIVALSEAGSPLAGLSPVTSLDDVRAMLDVVEAVYVHPSLVTYMAQLAAATRSLAELRLGVSPRGTVALMRAARAMAAAGGRAGVIPEDVKAVLPAVFTHRMLLSPDAELRSVSSSQLLERVVAQVPVPRTAPVS